MKGFLPVSLEDGKKRYAEFSQFDVVFVTGDPYYDHPLSGMSLIARLLDKKGYKVGIVAQPLSDDDFKACGKPKYFFCITSGLLDSMLANYTPMLREREGILVPERALMVYTQKVKSLFKSMTVIGGVEATIRRFTHFDYKDNKLRRGILNDTKADLLLFGNAERSILTLLKMLETGNVDYSKIDGAAYRVKEVSGRVLPSYEECVADNSKFSLLSRTTYLVPDSDFVEPCGNGFIAHNRPAHTLTETEIDYIYDVPFTRELHPDSRNYSQNKEMVAGLSSSVVIGRGCWGSCSFCVIPLVQGKEVAKRSVKSIVNEVDKLYASGVKKINDLTLPTLNMYGSKCALYKHESKIFSSIVDSEIVVYDKKDYCNQNCVGCEYRVISDDLYPLLVEVEKLNAKYSSSLELRSAIRHDIILDQKKLFRKIMQFVNRLKIAPESLSDSVLKQMNKSTASAFVEFLREYKLVNKEQGTDKNLVPYFVAAHPGSTLADMEKTKKFCSDNDIYVNLTQVFTPTPGTISTATYYTGENPLTREKVHVPRSFREKKDQKNVLLSDNYRVSDSDDNA